MISFSIQELTNWLNIAFIKSVLYHNLNFKAETLINKNLSLRTYLEYFQKVSSWNWEIWITNAQQ